MNGTKSQILANRFAALTREAGERFRRLSRSPFVIDEGHFACALLDADARLIAQEQGEPSQICAIQATVAHLINAFAFNLSEGDVIVTGDPYCGGTQGGTITLSVPVFSRGDLKFFASVRFAVPDFGGNVPGPFQPDAHEIWQESLRLTPVKLMKAGAAQKDVRQYLLKNSRAPAVLDSDLATAKVTAETLAAKIHRLVEAVGLAAVNEAMEYTLSYAKARMVGHFSQLANSGRGEATFTIDGLGTQCVTTAFQRSNDGVTLDFTGSSPSNAGAANLARAATHAAAITQLCGSILEETGINQGILDAVTIAAPEDSCVNPKFPAATSMGWRLTAPLVAAAIAKASGQACNMAATPPVVMVFDTIGTRAEILPVMLAPGFNPAQDLAGGDVFDGLRRLASAEQVESNNVFRLKRREVLNNDLEVEVEVLRDGFEAITVPSAQTGALRIMQDRPLARARSNVLNLARGAIIHFTYVTREGSADARK